MGEMEMDQETKEYLDRRLLPLVKRKDIEKLRQETKANFRQWKEETRTHLLDMIKELKTDLEKRGKEEKECDGYPLKRTWESGTGDKTSPNLWNQGLVLTNGKRCNRSLTIRMRCDKSSSDPGGGTPGPIPVRNGKQRSIDWPEGQRKSGTS